MKTRSAFTLVELMIVVGILAILSAIAVVSFRKYTLRARNSEAYTMLGQIRTRQESYRSEFSVYCDVAGTTGTSAPATGSQAWPTSDPGPLTASWDSSTPPAGWLQLGVRPVGGQVYYRYYVTAGSAGTAPGWGGGLGYNALPAQAQDMWWAADAFGDLDGDARDSTFETTSFMTTVYVDQQYL